MDGPTRHGRAWALALAALAALVWVAWGGVLRVPFHFDDYANLLGDAATRDAGALGRRLFSGVRPLLRLSHFVDHAVFGEDPVASHAVNLGLHVATVLCVFLLGRRRLALPGALCAAAIFALQPAHAEVIAYVSGRSTGLMAALLLAALCAYDRAQQRGAPSFARAQQRGAPLLDRGEDDRRWLLIAAALAAAACLVKEVALVFPALLFLWRPPRARAGFFLLLLALVLAALLWGSSRYRELWRFSLDLRGPLSALRVNLAALPRLLSLWFAPGALSVDHAFDASAVTDAAALRGAALVAGLVALGVLAWKRAPLVALTALWPLVALAPTNSVIAKLDVVTEKPLYLAFLGPALGAGGFCDWLYGRLGRTRDRSGRAGTAVVLAVGALLLCSAGVACARRVVLWQDARTLWADAVAKAPRGPTAARAWNNLGQAHALAGDSERAHAAFTEALRLDPDDVVARQNLARLALRRVIDLPY